MNYLVSLLQLDILRLVVPSANLLDDILNFPARRIYEERVLALESDGIDLVFDNEDIAMFIWFRTTFIPLILFDFLNNAVVAILETILYH